MSSFDDCLGRVRLFAAAAGVLLLLEALLMVPLGRADEAIGDSNSMSLSEYVPGEYPTTVPSFIPTTPQTFETDSPDLVSSAAPTANEMRGTPSRGDGITIPGLLEPFLRDSPVCDLPYMILHCSYEVTVERGGIEVVRERFAPSYRSDRKLSEDEQKEKCQTLAEIDAYEKLKDSLWGAGGISQLISLLEDREARDLLSIAGKNLLRALRVGKVPVTNLKVEADILRDSCAPIPSILQSPPSIQPYDEY